MEYMNGQGTPRSVSFDYRPPNGGDLFHATLLLTSLDQQHGRGSYSDGENEFAMDGYRHYTVTTYRPHKGTMTICANPDDVGHLKDAFDRILDAAGRG